MLQLVDGPRDLSAYCDTGPCCSNSTPHTNNTHTKPICNAPISPSQKLESGHARRDMHRINLLQILLKSLSTCSSRTNIQESLANAKVNVRQHCVSLSCLCNSLTQIEWVADLSQHLGSKVTHFHVNEMPITDYVLEYNNFSLGMKIRKI